jgi:TonB family protein
MKKQNYFKSQTVFTLIILAALFIAVIISIPSCNKNERNGENTELAAQATPSPQNAKTDSDDPYEVVDVIPVFPGGNDSLLMYISRRTNYPESAKTAGIQGKVVVRFVVEKDGRIDRISVLKGVNTDLDKEALRVISTLPDFEKPGFKNGKAVAVWMAIPISFMLR